MMEKVVGIMQREGGIVVLEAVASELNIPLKQVKEVLETLRRKGILYTPQDLDKQYRKKLSNRKQGIHLQPKTKK
jgi:hypothetical protein